MKTVLMFAEGCLDRQNYCSTESKEDVLVAVGTLLEKGAYFPLEHLHSIYPLILNNPYVEKWLACCCYIIVESKLDFSLS